MKASFDCPGLQFAASSAASSGSSAGFCHSCLQAAAESTCRLSLCASHIQVACLLLQVIRLHPGLTRPPVRAIPERIMRTPLLCRGNISGASDHGYSPNPDLPSKTLLTKTLTKKHKAPAKLPVMSVPFLCIMHMSPAEPPALHFLKSWAGVMGTQHGLVTWS